MKPTPKLYFIIIISITLVQLISGKQSIGDSCTLKTSGSPGTCKHLRHCVKAREDAKKNIAPQLCQKRKGSQNVVCCPNENTHHQRTPGEISREKCQEYAKNITDQEECAYVEAFVSGGKPAGRKEFPHMAAIGFEPNPGEIEWLCGGSLISPQYVLTAAHCLIHHEKGNATYAKLGVTKLSAKKHRQQIRISELIPYPEYRSSSHYHDIGLLRLKKPVELNSYARPACLYVKNEVNARIALATGWGVTEKGESSNILLKVTLQLFDHDFCNSTYKPYISRRLRSGILDDFQICAGSMEEIKNTCPGDSGGPLQIKSRELYCMYDIIGITSFGTVCVGNTGVYVRVSHYVKWIEDVVWPF